MLSALYKPTSDLVCIIYESHLDKPNFDNIRAPMFLSQILQFEWKNKKVYVNVSPAAWYR